MCTQYNMNILQNLDIFMFWVQSYTPLCELYYLFYLCSTLYLEAVEVEKCVNKKSVSGKIYFLIIQYYACMCVHVHHTYMYMK